MTAAQVRFLSALVTHLLVDTRQLHRGNSDPIRFPEQPTGGWAAWREWLTAWRQDFRFKLRSDAQLTPPQQMAANITAKTWVEVISESEGLSRLFDDLDPQSRDLFIQVLAFRMLGRMHVRLPLADGRYLQAIEQARTLVVQSNTHPGTPPLGPLNLYDLHAVGFPLRMHAHPINIINTFLLEQYHCRHANIGPEPGDRVLDGGACWGDSALYFAHRVGADGSVIAVEFDPGNLNLLYQNLALNPHLASRITVAAQPLDRAPGRRVGLAAHGPGSQIETGGGEFLTTTIDELAADKPLSFLKLDIEGAELAALHGAVHTLNRDRPRLAVALYHGLADFAQIPDCIRDLKLGYRLHLDHFTVHGEETVLFAAAGPLASAKPADAGGKAG